MHKIPPVLFSAASKCAADGPKLIKIVRERQIKEIAALSASATHTTIGPATAATVQTAIGALRSRHPEGPIVALVSPFLARVIRDSGLSANLTIIECGGVPDSCDTESSMLFIEGAVMSVVFGSPRIERIALGWRRFIPWKRKIIAFARFATGIADDSKVQEMITPSDDASNLRAISERRTSRFV